MKKIILTYGAIVGIVVITSMIVGMAMAGNDGHLTTGAMVGYLIMIVAMSLIFVAIKRYRDRDLGGVIRFRPAFLVGLGISAVAGVIYVGVWEGYLASTDHAFIEQYTTAVVDAQKEAGLEGAELDALVGEMDVLRERYANPLFRMPMTFLEIFPVGLLVSLIAALVLRKSEVLPAHGARAET